MRAGALRYGKDRWTNKYVANVSRNQVDAAQRLSYDGLRGGEILVLDDDISSRVRGVCAPPKPSEP